MCCDIYSQQQQQRRRKRGSFNVSSHFEHWCTQLDLFIFCIMFIPWTTGKGTIPNFTFNNVFSLSAIYIHQDHSPSLNGKLLPPESFFFFLIYLCLWACTHNSHTNKTSYTDLLAEMLSQNHKLVNLTLQNDWLFNTHTHTQTNKTQLSYKYNTHKIQTKSWNALPHVHLIIH